MAVIVAATVASKSGRHYGFFVVPFSGSSIVRHRTTTTTTSHHRTQHLSTLQWHLPSTLSSSPDYTRDISEQSAVQPSRPPLILPCQPDQPIYSVMAPMVAASDYPFRKLLRDYCGVDLLYTQMLHVKNFVNDANFRRWHSDFYECGQPFPSSLLPSQRDCLGSNMPKLSPSPPQSFAPLMVQLAGHDVDTVVQAALMVYEQTNGKLAGIDLNCGCPQNIAKKGNYGAFLMERDSQRVRDILTALRKHLPPEIAVSAKIRLPPEDDVLADRIARLVDTGINFMTVHGRTLKENKTAVGAVHADRIRLAIERARSINPDFAVVANGGMENYHDVQSILQYTGASAAMSSEALLETPNLFQSSSMDSACTPQDRFQQQVFFATKYLDICEEVGPPLPGVMGDGGSFGIVRGHFFKFFHRYLNADPTNIDLRDEFAGSGMRTLHEARVFVDKLQDRYAHLSPEDWSVLPSSNPESSWYRRHRKPDRRVHQRQQLHTVNEDDCLMNVEAKKREIKERIIKMKQQRQSQLAIDGTRGAKHQSTYQ
ncbi:dihydrouridine synthase Dus [Nitzschia inconspicua]|uniref:Dihydrouridine synthase Dus n=1 Tax=Nitzschia inconspicua TaxID=303405 RepID=A0A9K3L914_9STRA|nr:dihydrouridine synthase Dus [Nitzschia inconspicua]